MNNTLYDIRCKFTELMNNEELTEKQIQELGTELALELLSKVVWIERMLLSGKEHFAKALSTSSDK